MAKYATRRSYKNRASKKRRTIRKLKRTLRRKIQRGGLGEDVIIQIMLQLAPQVIPIILSLIKLGNVELLISIIKLLSGNQPNIGPGGIGGSKSNNRQLQRGGGLKEIVLGKLDGIAGNFTDKPDVLDCIGKIKDRINKQPEPAAAAPAPALDSSVELDSLTTELTTDTDTEIEITQADKDIVTKQDPELEALVEQDKSVTSNTPVDAPLPEAVAEAAKMSIINKMITFFNERIKSKITAKLDGMIRTLQDKKVGKDVIDCIGTLKIAIVEDIVTQIKNKASEISSRILDKIFSVGDKIFSVGGVIASDIITFLLWSSVQIALKNYSAIPKEGGKLLLKRGIQLFDAVAGRFGNLAGHVSDKAGSIMNMMRGNSENTNPVNNLVPPSDPPESMSAAAPQKPGLLGKVGSRFGWR